MCDHDNSIKMIYKLKGVEKDQLCPYFHISTITIKFITQFHQADGT